MIPKKISVTCCKEDAGHAKFIKFNQGLCSGNLKKVLECIDTLLYTFMGWCLGIFENGKLSGT